MSVRTAQYDLVTSIRFDEALLDAKWNNDTDGPCSFLFLNLHVERLRNAASQHGWSTAVNSITYEKLKSACQSAVSEVDSSGQDVIGEVYKIRVLLSKSGELRVSALPLGKHTNNPDSLFGAVDTFSLAAGVDRIEPKDKLYELWVDSKPTEVSLFTSTKTSQRISYNCARQRVHLSTDYSIPTDVVMYNTAGELMETSIFNIAVRRSSSWVTPTTESGCLPGVMRRWLLEQGHIKECAGDKLTRATLEIGEVVLLFNAVRGCMLGRISKFC